MKKQVLLLTILILTFTKIALAFPPLPTEIYGDITYFNQNASPGVVRAYVGTIFCGEFTMVNNTFYGLLDCVGDDPDTPQIEGGREGDTIRLTYNGLEGDEYGEITWHSGSFNYIHLIVPILYCGDGFCDMRESCETCPQDCGECPPPQGGGQGQAGNEGEQGEEGTEGGGGMAFPQGLEEYFQQECIENWKCDAWGPCLPSGLQYRHCVDLNHCGTTKNKPPEVRTCQYMPDCHNGIQDPGEEGIDCGGPCPPCASCFDGIKNCHDGACEEGVDCGGPCPPCGTCFDGIKNCHDGACEEGVDCGGPCKPCQKVLPVIEIPGLVCEKSFRKLFPWVIYFFAFILSTIILRYIYSRKKINNLKKQRKKIKDYNKEIELLIKEWGYKRRTILYSVTVMILSIIFVLFYYFFGMCPPYHYRIIALFVLSLIFVPLTIYSTLRLIEFNELKVLIKRKQMYDQHYNSLLSILEKNKKIIKEEEEKIETELEKITENKEIRKALMDLHIKQKLNRVIDIYFEYKNFKKKSIRTDALINELQNIYKDIESRDVSVKQSILGLINNMLSLLNIYNNYIELLKDIEEEEKDLVELVYNFHKERESKK